MITSVRCVRCGVYGKMQVRTTSLIQDDIMFHYYCTDCDNKISIRVDFQKYMKKV